MKKLIALLLALVLCLSLVACGGPDKQPAIDAYNKLATNYNAFVEKNNADLSGWETEDIEFFNECAAVITEYGNKLAGDTEFTQAEIDEMIEMFNEFNGIIEGALAETK